ncbi:MAG: hypothetical protein ACM3UZ_15955 [Acidobacteriota bacterium]
MGMESAPMIPLYRRRYWDYYRQPAYRYTEPSFYGLLYRLFNRYVLVYTLGRQKFEGILLQITPDYIALSRGEPTPKVTFVPITMISAITLLPQ